MTATVGVILIPALLTALTLASVSSSFVIPPRPTTTQTQPIPSLRSTVEADVETVAADDEHNAFERTHAVQRAKTHVLSVAERCYEDSKSGVFLLDPNDRRELKKAVAELEALCDPPSESTRRAMIGDWKLVCTTNSGSFGLTFNDDMFGRTVDVDTTTSAIDAEAEDESSASEQKQKKGPFGLPLPPPPGRFFGNLSGVTPQLSSAVRDKIRKSVEVTQKIRKVDDTDTDDDDEGTFSRVDNVVEFTPLTAASLLPDEEDTKSMNPVWGNVTSFLKKLPFNPLNVTKSKVSLIHKAEVESVSPVLRTKIALQSIVLAVAGTSQYLKPDGADILGLNVPLGEFLNSGSFDTTYVDEDIRISRGTIGILDELRVFTRKTTSSPAVASNKTTEDHVEDAEIESVDAELVDEEEEGDDDDDDLSPSDVE